MAQGRVTVNNLNLNQGSFTEVENTALFIGVAENNTGTVLSLTAQSDLDELLGAGDSELKTNIKAAIVNGGENWFAYAMPQVDGYDLYQAVESAMEQNVSPEIIPVCTPAATREEIENDFELAEGIRATYARRVIIYRATPGIDSTAQAWADYEVFQRTIVDGVRAERVGVVPQLHGNNLGCLVGRLCNRGFSIADSPLKTANGSVIGLGSIPSDVNGTPLSDATLKVLESARLTVNQVYPDYAGTYWSDGNLLDADGGDFQIVEHLRPVDAAARRVRILAIGSLGNRSFNDTPDSIDFSESYFSRPLNEMSRGAVINGIPFPGAIEPPSEDAITVIWESEFKMTIFIKVRPYKSPKDITVNLSLDKRQLT